MTKYTRFSHVAIRNPIALLLRQLAYGQSSQYQRSNHVQKTLPIVDITTTSVGRLTIRDTYLSFLRNIRYTGYFRVFVTIDPAYEVDAEEIAETEKFLRELPGLDPRIIDIHIERFTQHAGLETALYVLFAYCRSEVGIHLEDDWEFFHPINLDAMIQDLCEHGIAQIVFGNTHVASNGTFERPNEVALFPGTHVPLLRLLPSSWAAGYSPLCPHLHQTSIWIPAVVKALRAADADRCPDERIRDWVLTNGIRNDYTVLWTKDIVARDIGRSWLRARGLYKAIQYTSVARAPVAGVPILSKSNSQLSRSKTLLTASNKLIPDITHPFNKGPGKCVPGALPIFLDGGQGALVRDADGNQYIDFICGSGSLTLGHNHPAVTNAIRGQLGKGILHSLPTKSEVSAAQAVVDSIPGATMVWFLKTSSDACSAAVRLARYITGKERIVSIGCHGWHDQFTPNTPGVPKIIRQYAQQLSLQSTRDEMALFEYLSQDKGEIAAIVLAIPYSRCLSRDVVEKLCAFCKAQQVLFVLDEGITGFRLALGGVQEYFGVVADLVCLSNGLAAGMPLAALTGAEHVMRPLADLRVSTTFGSELLSLEVCKAVLRVYRDTDYITHINQLGRRLRAGINEAAHAINLPDIIVGYDSMPCLHFSNDPMIHARLAMRFLAAMACRGVLFRCDVNFICAAHTEEQVDFAVAAASDALKEMAGADLLKSISLNESQTGESE